MTNKAIICNCFTLVDIFHFIWDAVDYFCFMETYFLTEAKTDSLYNSPKLIHVQTLLRVNK
jgi:hypothetical protein